MGHTNQQSMHSIMSMAMAYKLHLSVVYLCYWHKAFSVTVFLLVETLYHKRLKERRSLDPDVLILSRSLRVFGFLATNLEGLSL